jgi:hypothetical protein
VLPHRLAEFAVTRDVDAEVSLPAHDIGHRGAEFLLKSVLVDRPGFTGPVCLNQLVGTRQAPGVTG